MGFPSGSAILVVVGVVILFFAVGGVGGVRSFSEGLGQRFAGSIPSLQQATADTGAGASEGEEARADQESPTPATFSVVQSRRNAGTLSSTVRSVDIGEFQSGLQEEIARSALLGSNVRLERGGTLLLDRPTTRLTRTLTGVGTAQFSTGGVGILTEAKRREIANRVLTDIERSDIAKLDARRRAAIERGVNPNVKLSGAELVLRKREQEEISKSFITSRFGGQAFVGGKLFANPNFCSRNLAGKLFC